MKKLLLNLCALCLPFLAQSQIIFQDDFESGNLNKWEEGAGNYSVRNASTTNPANGSYCLELTGSSGLGDGVSKQFLPIQLDSFSYNFKANDTSNFYSMIIGDSNALSNGGIFKMYLVESAGTLNLQIMGGFTVNIIINIQEWINVRVYDINWSAKTFTARIEYPLGSVQLNGWSFNDNSTTYASQFQISNSDSGTSYFDDIRLYGTYAAPVVNSEASDTTLCEGGNALFGILATTADSFAWQMNSGSGWSSLSNSDNDTLLLTAVTTSMDGYQYRCIAYNPSKSDTSELVTLSVNSIALVTLDPIDSAICIGNEMLFSVAAIGDIISYKWQYDEGSGWVDINNSDNDTLITNGKSGNTLLAIQDFESSPQSPTWTYTGTPYSLISGYSSSGATPANSPVGIGGSTAWNVHSMSGGNPLVFDNQVFSSSFDSIRLSFKLAAMNLSGTSGGPDNLDYVLVDYSLDGGSSWVSRIRVRGAINNNCSWPYSAETKAHVSYLPATESVFQPINSGLQLIDGIGTVELDFPGNISQLSIRITPRSSSSTDDWLIDSIALTGLKFSGGAFSSGTQFRCITYGICNNDTSESATLTINDLPVISSITSSRNPTTNGYAPFECTDLTATATGAASLTYDWSNAASGAVINVCPTIGTTYELLVTDGNGCQMNDTFRQSVMEATSPYPGRVIMCYNYRRRLMNINIYPSQVPQYLNAGATLGACGATPSKRNFASYYDDIYSIYPNPANNQINLEWFNMFNEVVNIELADMTGRKVKTIFIGEVLEGEMNLITADLSDLPVGMYFIRYSSPSDIRVNKVQVVR